jgi:hypothetical protein
MPMTIVGGSMIVLGLIARTNITSPFQVPLQPARMRCESVKYLDIPSLSRLAGQVPQHLKMSIYICANPIRIGKVILWVAGAAEEVKSGQLLLGNNKLFFGDRDGAGAIQYPALSF